MHSARYNHISGKLRLPERHRILGKADSAFDCALSGPFAKQFLTRLSAPRALCVVLNDVISASTVYDGDIISRVFCLVNSF